MHPNLQRLELLANALSDDPSVQAVLGLGSSGRETHRFDDHSDIDFFVIVDDIEAKQRYLNDITWLNGLGGELAFEFVNDPNGRKALLADGLLLEYAIFTTDQIRELPLVGSRVVWARQHYTHSETGHPRSAIDTVTFHTHEALTNLYVGLHREIRGERLTAMRFIQVYAVDRVLALQRLDPTAHRPDPDAFESTRRAELVQGPTTPDYAGMTPGYMHNAAAAAAILTWLTDHYKPNRQLVAAVEDLLQVAIEPS